MLKGIVFDLDGTLVDSLSVTFDGFNHAFLKLGSRKHTPQEIMKHFGVGERQIFAQMVGEANADAAYTLFTEYMTHAMGRVPMHSGAREVLEFVKSCQIPTAIVTGRGWTTTEIILKHHGILDQFITVVAHDHVKAGKPSPEGILLALSRMKLAPSEVMYVGDNWADTKAARAAGSISVAALWDHLADRSEIAPHEPHHWAEHPRDILKIWETRS